MSAAIAVQPLPFGDPLSRPEVLRELTGQYFVWDAFVSGARRVELQPLVLSPSLHADAVRAAEGVVRVLHDRVGARALSDRTERALYGFSADTDRLALASHRGSDSASLVRVDLLLGHDGRWRACEVNADCPGGHNESLALPHLARDAGFIGGLDPTRVVDMLVQRLATMARTETGVSGSVAIIYATAYAEDLQVCALVRARLARIGVRAHLVPPTAPVVRDGNVYVKGDRVTALYRFYPTEWMEGQANIAGLADAIEAGRLRTLSSFARMYSQSKLVMARAWSLADTLDTEDRAIVAAHVPITLDVAEMPRATLIAGRESWVLKRALGRVGEDVFVGPLFDDASWAGIVDDVIALRETGDRWIAQHYVPQKAFPTPWGERLVTLGAYVLDGRFAGYFARITPESHVSHDALCVPVFVGRAA